ncbi:MAG: amidohydrolase/deacetylase family metallohydrolase [Acidobacteria bacterium]|nr:amidohydrolase/deacetylase family metallohydrolase [Acidobacteriota bacterium]
MYCIRCTLALLAVASFIGAQVPYDLLLKGGHVIDTKNRINSVMDVAIAGGKIARVAANIPSSEAHRAVNVQGLTVAPGLIDIHVHVYQRPELKALERDSSVQPDAHTFREGVTTVVDAGTSGWRTFPDFRARVIDKAQTRVLALLNISGAGMGTGREDELTELEASAAARTATANRGIVVGFKTAHFGGPGWESIEAAVTAGKQADMPVMVDFGYLNQIRNLSTLLLDKLRPGDIYTHCYSGHREELVDGKVNPAMVAARKRGVIFDLGFGAGSFYWYVAAPAMQQGFPPDSISTDLHTGSMNAGMKSMTNSMSSILNLGAKWEDVIAMSTWNAAKEIKQLALGNLDVGAEADVAVLGLERGDFGFLDSAGAANRGSQRILCELTLRKGRVVWDRNGRAAADWKAFPYDRKKWTK